MTCMEKYVELEGRLEGKKTKTNKQRQKKKKKALQNETQEHSDVEAGRCWCLRDLAAFFGQITLKAPKHLASISTSCLMQCGTSRQRRRAKFGRRSQACIAAPVVFGERRNNQLLDRNCSETRSRRFDAPVVSSRQSFGWENRPRRLLKVPYSTHFQMFMGNFKGDFA